MIFSQETIKTRKEQTAKSLEKILEEDEVVLVHSGTPVQKPGGHDQTYYFHPHPDYYWLTGVRRPSGVSAYSKRTGWVDFVQPITREEKIWEGGGVATEGSDLSAFDAWFAEKKFSRTHRLGQHSESHWMNPLKDELNVLETFNSIRRVKDHEEIELVRKLAHIAGAGYTVLKDFIRPGVTEREIQLAYEGAVLKAGSEKMPYDTIVGAGTNAAVLHAMPTSRIVKEGDLVLVDGGADIGDYCVDITRVFHTGKGFSQQQKNIFDIVLKAQTDSIAMCKPGEQWHNAHLASARAIAQGLKDLGILRTSAEESVASGAVSVFFPHGVGHMVGLKVRDVGGPYNPYPKSYAGARVRVDMEMKEGYLMTFEPGLYFIEALLTDQETRAKYKDAVNWEEAMKWLPVGGVRLEDDVVIKAQGNDNLTGFIPKI